MAVESIDRSEMEPANVPQGTTVAPSIGGPDFGKGATSPQPIEMLASRPDQIHLRWKPSRNQGLSMIASEMNIL